jgi:hypothetical protein
MKIVKIVVTDEGGIEHEWDGVEGFVRIASVQAKTKPYQQRIEASLLLPARPDVKPTPEELASQR